MAKNLSEMTLEELWQLFPIILKAHNPEYEKWYREEEGIILSFLDPKDVARISHIGSTAVPGLIAKPTVDILLEVGADCDTEEMKKALTDGGWGIMRETARPDWGMSLNKGYTPEGFAEKVFHLHVRFSGDWDELYFRDYLRAHADAAEEYAKLKLKLWDRYRHDRDGYTEAKSAFVKAITRRAREEFPGRHMPE